MSYLENIFARLEAAGDTPVLQELREGRAFAVTGHELSTRVSRARSLLGSRSLKKGDRCALLAHNGIDWVVLDLAIMAEGLVVVPLYARQATAELVAMMKDCSPALICCADATLRDGIVKDWRDAPARHLFDDIFTSRNIGAAENTITVGTTELADSDAVTIIYTSGTSGEPKGVVLTAGNITHMLGCTSGRLDILMENKCGHDRVFHYLPFCFAASWIVLLTCLLRRSLLTLNTDLGKLAQDMRAAAPDYFLNVPALLERMRKGVDEQLWQTGGLAQAIYGRAKAAWIRLQERQPHPGDSFWLWLAHALVFPTIRKKMIGSKLKALISGSAPLNVETQCYFMMLGIPVLQGYGLTETTGICTLDDPRHVEPGRVGPTIPEIEMKLGENDEILVRGPTRPGSTWRGSSMVQMPV